MDYLPTENVSFYELESTSPLRELAPNSSITHHHAVYHFFGTEAELQPVATKLLGVDLASLPFR